MVKIKRNNQLYNHFDVYDIYCSGSILDLLDKIKTNIDETVSYRHGCKSGVCGSCAIRVNGVEKLACKTKSSKDMILEPIKNSKVLKDLIVDFENEHEKISKAEAFLNTISNEELTKEDEEKINKQSDCILCQSCYSSCPVFDVNKSFLGPYALTRVLRYTNDKKEANKLTKLTNIQENGIWDCTLCGLCTVVCPQGIDPKTDIMNLRMQSVQNGFEDKSFKYQDDFNTDFGFNPNMF